MILSTAWGQTVGGHDYWSSVIDALDNEIFNESGTYKVPDDHDAKSRPLVQFRSRPDEQWREGTLYGVYQKCDVPFAVYDHDRRCIMPFPLCRMRIEQLKREID